LPQVDVKSEGANVIVVKMTFPDNESIQGLRAFSPTKLNHLDLDLVPVLCFFEKYFFFAKKLTFLK
jgi:hypothetical protein